MLHMCFDILSVFILQRGARKQVGASPMLAFVCCSSVRGRYHIAAGAPELFDPEFRTHDLTS